MQKKAKKKKEKNNWRNKLQRSIEKRSKEIKVEKVAPIK